jgi:diaminobutyrate-2-oxoglutarate transaminase
MKKRRHVEKLYTSGSFFVFKPIFVLLFYFFISPAESGRCRKTILLRGPVPGAKAQAILQIQHNIESSAVSYPTRYPLVPKRAKGSYIEDVDGNVFLDFFMMAGALPLGHNPPQLQTFVRATDRLTTTLDFPTIERVTFLQLLQKQLSPSLGDGAILHLTGPTGTDAVEAALKLARYKTQSDLVIAFNGGYHGMTAGASAVTSGTGGATWKAPRKNTIFANFPQSDTEAQASLKEIEATLKRLHRSGKRVAATIVEPIQGEGGSVVPPEKFLAQLSKLMHEYGALVIADEVQSGFGRSGSFFASEAFPDFSPDILVFSKAASGVGAPLGGIAFKPELNGWEAGSSIGTFRGFTPAFASGAKTIELLSNPRFLENVNEKGNWARSELKSKLQDVKHVANVRGRGLMIGIEIVNPKTGEADSKLAKQIAQNIFHNGVIVEIGGLHDNVIRLLPALNINKTDLENGIEIIQETIAGFKF